MPKASASSSSASGAIAADASSLSEVNLKKRKNADAQAAFRARRANYISTLEHTVTTLESVVVQLQTSCRDSHSLTEQIKAEYARLKHEYRERETFWRTLWHSKKTSGSDLGDDLPALPESLLNSGPQFPTYTPPSPPTYPPQSSYYNSPPQPSLSYVEADSSHHHSAQRGGDERHRYHPYSYSVPVHHHPSPSDGWSSNVTAPPSPASASGSVYGPSSAVSPIDMNGTHHHQHPHLPHPHHTHHQQHQPHQHHPHRSSLPGIIDAPYTFSETRSISPMSTPSTPAPQNHHSHHTHNAPSPNSSSSSSASAPYSLPPGSFPSSAATSGISSLTPRDRANDFDFHSPKNEVTFHGGMADVLPTRTGPGSDALRQRLAMKREPSSTSTTIPRQHTNHLDDRPFLPPLQTGLLEPPSASVSPSSSGPANRPPILDALSANPHQQHNLLLQLPPRSPSPSPADLSSPSPPALGSGPGTPQISDTLAVIKASAFGALRRARTRKKNSADLAAKAAAHDVLEARGLHLGSFRQPQSSAGGNGGASSSSINDHNMYDDSKPPAT